MAAKLIRSSEIAWEELDGEAILVQPATKTRWLLNAAAAGIWKLCDGTRSVQDLAKAFARMSGNSAAEATRELVDFCEKFSQLGLLCTQPAGAKTMPASLTLACMSGLQAPAFRELQLGSGPRRRPSPRGNSGPG